MTTAPRTVVLLGAGASSEADLPVSVGLTKRIVDQVAGEPWQLHRPEARALHMAIGAIVAHDTANGGNAYEGIDVERLFSAVEMLSDRPNLEVAPFVSQWIGGLDRLSARPRFPSDSDFDRAAAASGIRGLGGTVRKAIEAMVDVSDADSVFKSLRGSMIDSLRQALICDRTKLDYLAPLLQIPGDKVRIATLNYDLTIETLANGRSIDLDTGAGTWTGGFGWVWRHPASVQLLKLHGSIDWLLKASKLGGEGFSLEQIESFPPTPDSFTRWVGSDQLGVIFGRRGKLRAEGPFTAMLVEFERWLADSDELVIVGYSYRDAHINAIVRRRIATGPLRVRMVDPILSDWQSATWWNRSDQSDAWAFRRDLLAAAGMTHNMQTGEYEVPDETVYPIGAGQGLQQIFGDSHA